MRTCLCVQDSAHANALNGGIHAFETAKSQSGQQRYIGEKGAPHELGICSIDANLPGHLLKRLVDEVEESGLVVVRPARGKNVFVKNAICPL